MPRSWHVCHGCDPFARSPPEQRRSRSGAPAHRFQHLDLDGIDDPGADWDPVLAQVPETVERVTSWLIYHLDAEFGPTSIVSSTPANTDRCRTIVTQVLADMQRGVPAPDLPPEYRPTRKIPEQRRPNAVPTLIDAGRLADGRSLTYRAPTKREREAMAAWLAEDPRCGTARWVNQRVRPLLWAVDG
jgi:hypothetical protein